MMEHIGSVTHLMLESANGDEAAALALWKRFRGRLVGLAKERLAGVRHATADEEDVANEAFYSLLKGMRAGRYNLPSRDRFWQLLACIAVRRANTTLRRELAQKRRGTVGEAELSLTHGVESLSFFADDEPAPATLVEINSLISELFGALEAPFEHEVLLLKLEGFSLRQVAERLGVGLWRVRKTATKIEQFLLDQTETVE